MLVLGGCRDCIIRWTASGGRSGGIFGSGIPYHLALVLLQSHGLAWMGDAVRIVVSGGVHPDQ